MNREDRVGHVRRNRLGEHLPADEDHLGDQVLAGRPGTDRLGAAEAQTILERGAAGTDSPANVRCIAAAASRILRLSARVQR